MLSKELKISITIPQYNRINYLLKSLSIIEQQSYSNLEIVISDDCSSDDTVAQITALIPTYKYPIIFGRNETNMGYDRNYRKCIEMASGEYALVMGNDDSINGSDAIEFLANFLQQHNLPDIGFCNMLEERTNGTLIKRASGNRVIGTGADVAVQNYSCFSFVGGLVYKRETFLKHNTSKYDGSIFAQMYLGVYMISMGAVLFCIEKPLILKDILLDGIFRNSYRDRIAKKWKDYRVVDGGLPSVMNVLIGALRDAGELTQKRIYLIVKRVYSITFPHWVLDYKENAALPEAVGLIQGLYPLKNQSYRLLNTWNRIKVYFIYLFSGFSALIVPVFLFKMLKQRLYTFFKG